MPDPTLTEVGGSILGGGVLAGVAYRALGALEAWFKQRNGNGNSNGKVTHVQECPLLGSEDHRALFPRIVELLERIAVGQDRAAETSSRQTLELALVKDRIEQLRRPTSG